MELQSATNVIATKDIENLAYGGKSSSATLNKIHNAIKTDITSLASDAEDVRTSVNRLVALVTSQSSSISAAILALQEDLAYVSAQAATASDGVHSLRFDMFMAPLVTDGDYTTTCTVSRKYGQATLPVVGESNWLSVEDLDGNIWVPDQTKLYFMYGDDLAVLNNVSEESLWLAEDTSGAFDQEAGTLWVEETNGSSYATIYIEAPLSVLVGGYSNCLELDPFPILTHDLMSIQIISTNGDRYSVVFGDYLPGYVDEGGDVYSISNFGNTRIFFPPAQVAGIRLSLRLDTEQDYFGFTGIALKTVKFDNSGKLTINIAQYSTSNWAYPTITTEIKGEDESYLNSLTTTVISDEATSSSTGVSVDMVQQASGYSPVISAIDVAWN